MKIGVIGFGYVGKALAEGLKISGNHKIFVNDKVPAKSQSTLEELARGTELIFVCVQTPTLHDGTQDLTNILQVAEELNTLQLKVPPIIIKSTVLPGTCKMLNHKYNPRLRFSSSPEFFRQQKALEDFLSPDRIVIGTDYPDVYSLFCSVFKKLGPIVKTDSSTAEFIKYASNVFLVYKVAFALEMSRYASELNVQGDVALEAVGMDSRIGSSHLDPFVGKIPVYSPCLPKDFRAFKKLVADSVGYSKLLEVTEEISLEK